MDSEEKTNLGIKLKRFIGKSIRVLKVARKPTSYEVKQISKVSALGISVIGVVGFIIGLFFLLFII